MLHIIKDFADSLLNFLKDDPVRPHIPKDIRVGTNKDIFVKTVDDKPQAITCVSYQKLIPTVENELFEIVEEPEVAVFYTIWSYEKGAGKDLLFDSVKYIIENRPSVKRFVTLSPKTEMAHNFHTRNGAVVFRENTETTNYEYISF